MNMLDLQVEAHLAHGRRGRKATAALDPLHNDTIAAKWRANSGNLPCTKQ
jgi:hypothetical protein